mmetsp:Transcript_31278/g.96850  ORF Transcript_31278/g.96850 Transcript_31278/m.96850 type:complete len:311 (+) Transcript_31278:153-1085(+)
MGRAGCLRMALLIWSSPSTQSCPTRTTRSEYCTPNRSASPPGASMPGVPLGQNAMPSVSPSNVNETRSLSGSGSGSGCGLSTKSINGRSTWSAMASDTLSLPCVQRSPTLITRSPFRTPPVSAALPGFMPCTRPSTASWTPTGPGSSTVTSVRDAVQSSGGSSGSSGSGGNGGRGPHCGCTLNWEIVALSPAARPRISVRSFVRAATASGVRGSPANAQSKPSLVITSWCPTKAGNAAWCAAAFRTCSAWPFVGTAKTRTPRQTASQTVSLPAEHTTASQTSKSRLNATRDFSYAMTRSSSDSSTCGVVL